MSRRAVAITLTLSKRMQLERWGREPQTARALPERARIILATAAGLRNYEIVQRCRSRRARLSKWRWRFARQRCAGLLDTPRPGQPVKYGLQRFNINPRVYATRSQAESKEQRGAFIGI